MVRHRIVLLVFFLLLAEAAWADDPAPRYGWGAEGPMPPELRAIVLDAAPPAMQANGRLQLVTLPDVRKFADFQTALRAQKLTHGFWIGWQPKDHRQALFVWLVEAKGGEPPFRAGLLGEGSDRPVDLVCRLAWELLEPPLAPAAERLVAQAHEAWRAGDLPRAEDLFRKSLIVSELAAQPCRDAGRMFQENGRPDVAVQWYQAALARNPYDYLTYLWLASLHGQLDQAEDARMALEGALRAGPRIPYLLTTLAFQYRQTGRLAEAQELLQEAARLDDTNGTTWLSLLNVAEINHDWAVAAHALRRVLELSGGNEDLHRLLASYQLQAGDYASAEQTLARLRQTNPNDEALFKDTIRLLVDTGRWDEAETQLTGFLRQNPDAAWAHAALGRIYYQTKRFDRATASLEKAHDLDPGDEQVERLLNKTYELAGDKQRSFNYYERRLLSARRFTSDELDRYLSLARDLNEMPRAAETLRRLSDGNLPAAQRTAVAVARGRLLEQDGRTAEAIAVYRGLLTRRSRPAQVLHELGRLHFQLGEAAAGEAYFRELAYSTGDARLLMSAARLSAQRSARSLAADLYGAAYRADPRQTSAGVLYLESLLLADEDRGNAQLVWDLDQVVRQDDERELLFWLELFWAADQGRADYFDPLLPHALRFIAKRPETKVELVAWPTVVQARFFGDEQTRLLDLLRVFTRQMSAADFARRYHVPLGQP